MSGTLKGVITCTVCDWRAVPWAEAYPGDGKCPACGEPVAVPDEMARDRHQRAAIARDPYAGAVIGILAGEFPELQDPETAALVRKYIYAHARVPGHLEVIVDNPINARWRLTGDRDHPGRVRLGCWHIPPLSDSVRERQERINAALQAIQTGD